MKRNTEPILTLICAPNNNHCKHIVELYVFLFRSFCLTFLASCIECDTYTHISALYSLHPIELLIVFGFCYFKHCIYYVATPSKAKINGKAVFVLCIFFRSFFYFYFVCVCAIFLFRLMYLIKVIYTQPNNTEWKNTHRKRSQRLFLASTQLLATCNVCNVHLYLLEYSWVH